MSLERASNSAIYNEWNNLEEDDDWRTENEDWKIEKLISSLDSGPTENLIMGSTSHTPPPYTLYELTNAPAPQLYELDDSDLRQYIPTVTPTPPDEIFDSPNADSLSEHSTHNMPVLEQSTINTFSNKSCSGKSHMPLSVTNSTIPVGPPLPVNRPLCSGDPTNHTVDKPFVFPSHPMTVGGPGATTSYSVQPMTTQTRTAVPFNKIQDDAAATQPPSPDSESVSHPQPPPPSQLPQGSQLLPANVTQAVGLTSDGFTLTTFTMPKFMMYQVQQSMQNPLPTVLMPQPSVSALGGVPPATSSSSGGMLDVPNLSDLEGEYGFTVTVEEKERTLKSPMWLMSPVTHKLYTNINKAVPFEVHLCKPPADTSSLCVKAVPVFSSPQFLRTNVTRCPNHSAPTDPTNHDFPYPEYVVRADHPEARYVKGPSGRLAVVVPLDPLQNGPNYTPILLRFMCLGSCVGGINRRPIAIVLTLENQQEVLGRKVIDVRVCACPTRDIKTDEQAAKGAKRKGNAGQEKELAPRKKPKMGETKTEADDDDQYYTLTVRGRKLYNFMMGMKELYYKTHPEYAMQYSDPSSSHLPSIPLPKREMKVKEKPHQRDKTEEVDSGSWEMQPGSPSSEHLDEPQKDPLDITEETSSSSSSVGPQVKLYVVDHPIPRETSTGNGDLNTSSQAGLVTPSCAKVTGSSPSVNSPTVTSQSTVLLSRHIPVVPVTSYKPSFRRVASEPKFPGIRQSLTLPRNSATSVGQGQKLGEVSPVREGSVSPASREMLAANVLIGGFYQDDS